MKTIKLLLTAALIIAGISLSAQDKKFTFGVKAGLNMSSISGDISDTKVRFGYNVGVTADYAINQNWYILSGLEYTTKGVNGSDGESIHAAYIQLPVHAGYKLEVAPGTKLIFHAGPYLAYGTNGNTEITVFQLGDLSFGGKAKTFDIFRRFDAGLGLGIGAEFGKFGVDLGWDYGLVNMVEEGKGSLRTGNAYLSASYKF